MDSMTLYVYKSFKSKSAKTTLLFVVSFAMYYLSQIRKKLNEMLAD